MDSDGLRRTFDSRAVAACNAAGLAGRVTLSNEEFRPNPKEICAEFWIKEGNTGQAEHGIGTGFEKQAGIWQMTLYAPENKGSGPIKKIADLIRPRFNRRQWEIAPNGYVSTGVASIVTPYSGPQNGKFVVVVWGPFTYYYRDPNALPFRD